MGTEQLAVIVRTSDHGELLGAHGGLHQKWFNLYDEATRVPFNVVRVGADGVRSAPATVEEPTSHVDLVPTLLGAAGIEIPADHAARVEGIDLRSVLDGREAPPADRSLLFHQPHFWGVNGPGIEPFSAVRVGNHKLIYFHSGAQLDAATGKRTGGPRFELYDLSTDVGEAHDLAAERPATVAALAQVLSARLEAAGASMSIDLRSGLSVPLPRAAQR